MILKDRILCLDVGDKRIGVSVSDPFGLFASPVGVIYRNDDNSAIEEVKNYCKTYNVKKILCGLPYNMDGTLGIQAKKTMNFVEKINEYEIIYRDERLTSFEAEEILKKEKKKYTKNKGLVDIKSACIILQSYLGELQ